ncbi:MAG: hypothetical protein WCQ32_03840 [bacterium]
MFDETTYIQYSKTELKKWDRNMVLRLHCAEVFDGFFYQFPAGKKPYVTKFKSIEEFGHYRHLLLQSNIKINKFIKTKKGIQKLQVSPKEFYKELDLAVVECGIDPAHLYEVLNPIATRNTNKDTQWRTIYKYLTRIYIHMRKKGYPKETLIHGA